jgi:chromosome segregation ATPase
MTLNPTQKMNRRGEAVYLRRSVTVLTLMALLVLVPGVVVFVTRAQNPNCADLKKRLDDATRAYQTVLMQSQTVDKKFASYESAIRKLQGDLIATDTRRVQAERDIAEAQRDRARCERDPGMLAADACANVRHRTDTAEKRLIYARAVEKRLESELSDNQQRRATTKGMLQAANASLTAAQLDLDEANKAYATAGCATETNRTR